MELDKAYSTNNKQNTFASLHVYPIQKICNCVDGAIITTNDGNRKQTCTSCGKTWTAPLIDDVTVASKSV